jgi:diguanylate cyclase (GGDEF)-like protein
MNVFDELETSEHWVLTPSHQGLSYEHVLAEAGERPLDEPRSRSARQLREDRGAGYFSELLFALTHKRYAPEQAERMWQRIVQHRDRMSLQLGRNPGVTVAALDYLSNVEGCFKRPTLIDELKLAHLVDSATRDDLTGLFDRAALRQALERACQSDAQPVSVIMIDLDDFKHFNDSQGHLAGDRALARAAEIVQKDLRDTDIPARYGGEEFCVVLPGRTLSEAATVAERLRLRIEQELGAQGVTASFGVASSGTQPKDAAGPLALLRAADNALYASKRSGKNRVTIADETC